jgi:hypothetical protein
VIELKRDETGEHMDLQAIRYAAMVSTLTFQRAVEIYEKFLKAEGSEENAFENISNFLKWSEPDKESFGSDVRIVLVSSDFSKELTTSVMWLTERDIDIRCVRLIPYRHNSEVLIDAQQIIPLPEVESYQVRIKEKQEEKRDAIRASRDHSRYEFNGRIYNKRKLVLAVIKEWVSQNNPESIKDLMQAFPDEMRRGRFFTDHTEALEIYERNDIPRHFLDEQDLLRFSDDSKYAITNQWGKDSIERFAEHIKSLGYKIAKID